VEEGSCFFPVTAKAMKSHRQYVKEQIKSDSRWAKDLAETRSEVRSAVIRAKPAPSDRVRERETGYGKKKKKS